MTIVNGAQLSEKVVEFKTSADDLKRQAEALTQLKKCIQNLYLTVSAMTQLYDENPFLNEAVDIGKLVPMSLDEWSLQINEWLDPAIVKCD